MQIHIAVWSQHWRFISTSTFSAPQPFFSGHSFTPDVCGILVPCRAQSSPQLCKFKGFCSQFLPERWFTAQVAQMSLPVVQLNGKQTTIGQCNSASVGEQHPHEHSRQLKVTKPTPNFCKKPQCIPFTDSQRRQAGRQPGILRGQKSRLWASLHPEHGHSTRCQALVAAWPQLSSARK